ncbi:hypothetical protein [Haladaptatus salinisoli]|uniref:hypothetical protein n=1 Tax=Haladaptatus salinisoli TaxID=2884876 RepID=UPI001D09D201|nr:hypothetical protein [Haladaptatus salinisoli]
MNVSADMERVAGVADPRRSRFLRRGVRGGGDVARRRRAKRVVRGGGGPESAILGFARSARRSSLRTAAPTRCAPLSARVSGDSNGTETSSSSGRRIAPR